MQTYNTISIAIPTYKRPELLRRCLSAFDHDAIVRNNLELVVTDDSPDDLTRDLIAREFQWIGYLKGPGRGLSANRNNAISGTESDWIFFVDDDCYPLEGYCDAVRRAVDEATGPCLFEGPIVSDRPRKSLAETAPLVNEGGSFVGANIGLHKEIVDLAGGFDEEFTGYGYEEIEFHHRCNKLGFGTSYVEEAYICHPWRPQHSVAKRFPAIGNELRTCNLHPELWTNKHPATLAKIAAGRFVSNARLARQCNWKGATFIASDLILDVGRVIRFSAAYPFRERS